MTQEPRHAAPSVDPLAPAAAPSPAAPAATSAPAPAGSRAARRAAREAMLQSAQANSRRRLLKVGGVVLVVVVVLGLLVALLAGGDDDGGASADGGAGERVQRTVLVQLVPAGGDPAVATALVAADPAAIMTVPGRLLTEVAGRGSIALEEVVASSGGGARAQAALSDQLEIAVDGSWVLDSTALTALVTSVGGVPVDVDTDVRVTTVPGTSTVVLTAGEGQLLDGPRATAYAGYLAAGEPEAARLARFTQVLRALLAKLPEDEAELVARLTATPGATSTLTPDQLAPILGRLRGAVLDDAVAYPALPVVSADVGGDRPTYRLKRSDLEAVIAADFADSRLPVPPGGRVEVYVQNGVGTSGLLEQARLKLRAANLTFLQGGNAPTFGYARSLVIVPDDSAQSRERGALVATSLGLAGTAVAVGNQGAGVADVVVILGDDFRP
jgi:hypothetical protein